MQQRSAVEMGAIERWAFVKDGRIYLHQENDGWTFLRRGPEAVDKEISLGELASRYPSTFEELVKEEKALYHERVVKEEEAFRKRLALPPFDKRS
jgi:hypothetical protein